MICPRDRTWSLSAIGRATESPHQRWPGPVPTGIDDSTRMFTVPSVSSSCLHLIVGVVTVAASSNSWLGAGRSSVAQAQAFGTYFTPTMVSPTMTIAAISRDHIGWFCQKLRVRSRMIPILSSKSVLRGVVVGYFRSASPLSIGCCVSGGHICGNQKRNTQKEGVMSH